MDNIQISNALHEGLMSAKEVEDVLKLLRKPDVSPTVLEPNVNPNSFVVSLRESTYASVLPSH